LFPSASSPTSSPLRPSSCLREKKASSHSVTRDDDVYHTRRASSSASIHTHHTLPSNIFVLMSSSKNQNEGQRRDETIRVDARRETRTTRRPGRGDGDAHAQGGRASHRAIGARARDDDGDGGGLEENLSRPDRRRRRRRRERERASHRARRTNERTVERSNERASRRRGVARARVKMTMMDRVKSFIRSRRRSS